MSTVWNTTEQTLAATDIQEQYEILFAFADPTRLQVLQVLREKDRNVTDILKRLTGVSQPNLSKHLNVLHGVELLTREKRGREVFYGLADGVESFLQGLTRWQRTYGPSAPPPPSIPAGEVPSTVQTAASVRSPAPQTIFTPADTSEQDAEPSV